MLSQESWSNVYNCPVEAKYEVFFKVFYYYFDFCFPRVKSRKCTKNEKWITADIVNDKNEIQCLARSNRYSKDLNSNLALKDKKKLN